MSEVSIAELLVPDLHRRSARAHARIHARNRHSDSNSESSGWTATWPVWGSTASVTVTEPTALPAARRLVGRQLAAAEKAAARFRKDAEVHRLYRAGGREITVSPLLAELIAAALAAAERTDGDVDPTVAAAITALQGQRGRDASAVPACGTRSTGPRPVPGWQQVELQGRRLRVPAGSTLDLSATATAFACDLAAAAVRARLNIGVLVTLGGDAASAGPAPEGGWRVLLDERADRRTEVLLPAGAALATSHFTARPGRFEQDPVAERSGQLIDPHTGRPPTEIWRMVTAIGFSSLEAASYTAAALIRGPSARAWLAQLWVPARLVTVHDDVIAVGPWSAHQASTATSATSLPTPRQANLRRTTH